jgi:hypothetical protein
MYMYMEMDFYQASQTQAGVQKVVGMAHDGLGDCLQQVIVVEHQHISCKGILTVVPLT